MFSAAAVSRLSPFAKLALWAIAVVVIAGAVQLLAVTLGLNFSVFEKQTGSVVAILIAFACLLVMMAVESRPMADYGLVADAKWRQRAMHGVGIGAGFYLAYCVFVCWIGVFELHPESSTPVRWLKSAAAIWSAAPVAITQQIIFSGYLLTTLRDRHSQPMAILVPAILFALATGSATENGLGSVVGGRLFVGTLLIQTLLGMLRLRTGSIVLPAGLLAGAIMIRKVSSTSRLIDADWHNADLWWTAPHGDPRQAAAMWCFLAIAIVGVGISLWRNGECRLEANSDVDASFKRYMPFSNLFGLATLDRWVVLLWQAKFRIGLLYIPRLIVSLIGSAAFTLLALPERLIAPLLLRHEVPPPIFIVGMPRSGTTHLHNLLALDPQFRSPRNYEVFNPHGFLTGWLTTALLTPILTWRRPMDSVQMTIFSAQEEEFALAAMGSPSPYWGFCLPKEIDRHDRYWRPEGFTIAERNRWQRHYRLLLRKLTLRSPLHPRRRRPLLKNPANTGRVSMLKALFPEAKFVHIVRHPDAVWQSNQRLAEHGLAVFQLQDPAPQDNYATRSLANYRQLVDAYNTDVDRLLPEDAVELRFEDLEADPKATIMAIYQQLKITPSPEFEPRLQTYLDGISGYRKNRFPTLSDQQRQQIRNVMGPYLAAWGYDSLHVGKEADTRVEAA
ncbi:MAG: sulfotransferase [Planctomycetota bacterium]